MGFARKLSEEHDSNAAWTNLNIVYVVNQGPDSLETGSLEHLKDNAFGVGNARAAGEAKRTIMLDRAKTFYGYLGTSEFSVLGQLARLLSGYWLPTIARSLWNHTPRGFVTALIDVRIGSFVWRGRTPGGVLLADSGETAVLTHAETQPGDHVEWEALNRGVLALNVGCWQ